MVPGREGQSQGHQLSRAASSPGGAGSARPRVAAGPHAPLSDRGLHPADASVDPATARGYCESILTAMDQSGAAVTRVVEAYLALRTPQRDRLWLMLQAGKEF